MPKSKKENYLPKEFDLGKYKTTKGFDNKLWAGLLKDRAYLLELLIEEDGNQSDVSNRDVVANYIINLLREPSERIILKPSYPSSSLYQYRIEHLAKDLGALRKDKSFNELFSQIKNNVSASEEHYKFIDTTFPEDFLEAPLDEAIYTYNPTTKIIKLDLNAPEKLLKQEFITYIKKQKKDIEVAKSSPVTANTKIKQISDRWLPLLDLYIYSRSVNSRLTLEKIYQAVWSDDSPDQAFNKGENQLSRARSFLKNLHMFKLIHNTKAE